MSKSNSPKRNRRPSGDPGKPRPTAFTLDVPTEFLGWIDCGPFVFDRRGVPILPGDTVRTFQYTSSRRRQKIFAYRWVEGVCGIQVPDGRLKRYFKVSFLDLSDNYYLLHLDNQILVGTEIVQGFTGVPPGKDFKDREARQSVLSRIGCARG